MFACQVYLERTLLFGAVRADMAEECWGLTALVFSVLVPATLVLVDAATWRTSVRPYNRPQTDM